MVQSEYVYIRNNDWDALNRAIRRGNERLAILEGYGGMSEIHSDVNMQGNKITNGPVGQKIAAEDEFITRDYLASRQAGIILNRNLSPGGKSPLILSPGLPGASSIGGQLTLPPTVIEGGGTGSVMTDFTSATGYWNPIYNPNNHMFIEPSVNGMRVYCDRAVSTVWWQMYAGVTPRFSIVPSPAGRVEFIWSIENLTYTPFILGDDAYWGVGCYLKQLGRLSTFSGNGFSAFASLDTNNSLTDWIPAHHAYNTFKSVSQYSLDNFTSPGQLPVGTGPINGDFRLVFEVNTINTSSVFGQVEIKKFSYRVAPEDAWTEFIMPDSTIDTQLTFQGGGLRPFIGIHSIYGGVFDGRISKFELVEGYALV